ncbi:Ig-like domain-containing protein [Luteolibacter arcticus]|uniref:Ig-like domain-containing protein n=1 Tax=Luteolibacter arcticus TaxID=1581411 RepID=A0ABT3GMS3_9BACT|nr:Ig-like domain-containing protein [Luteolibacter arcticus]MCW1924797.1 Ig-like domain-containing protein [Luteolibacter arcticus]
MLCSPQVLSCLLLAVSSAGLEAAISSSVYYLNRSRQAEGLEDLSMRISVSITEGTLALGAASTAVLEDPQGGQYAITGDARSGNVSFGASVPLERIEDAGGVWKLTVNEGAGVDEDLRIHIPATDATAFPIYPQFPAHPYQGNASRIRFVWNTASSAISPGGGTVVSTANGSSVYSYTPGGPKSVDVSHIQSINGATIKNPDGTPRGPVTTQSLTSESRMEVFTDAESRVLSGQTTPVDGALEFLASGLTKGNRYAILGKTGDDPWTEIQRFVAVSNAHLYVEEAGEEERSFMVEADPNRAPVADGQTLTAVEDTPLGFTPSGSDADGDELTFEIVTPPTKGVLEASETGWTYVPNANATGADEFTFRADDGAERAAFSEEAQVALVIAPVNDVPVAADAEFFTMKGGAIAFTLPSSDVDGDSLTYQVLGAPAKGKLNGTAPHLSYKAAGAGQWSIRYTVSDGSLVSEPGTITLRVRGKNQKPVAQAGEVTANVGERVLLPLTGLDTDHDALTYAITKQPKNGVVTGTPPALFYQSAPGFRGSDQVSFVVKDGGASSKPAVIKILVVNPNNHAPVAKTLVTQGPVKKAVSVTLGGTDADGDSLSFRVTSQPENGKLTGKVPNLKLKPAAGFVGSTSFSYVANDGSLDSAPATVTVTIGSPIAD